MLSGLDYIVEILGQTCHLHELAARETKINQVVLWWTLSPCEYFRIYVRLLTSDPVPYGMLSIGVHGAIHQDIISFLYDHQV